MGHFFSFFGLFRFLAISICLWGVLCPKILKAESVNLDLVIELKGFPKQEKAGKKKLAFSEVCKTFGIFLSQNRGIYASGPFQTVRCEEGDAAKNSKSDANWHLRIHGDSSNKIFEIYRKSANRPEKVYVTYSLATEVGPITLMAKKDTNALIAFYLSQGLPFRSSIQADSAVNGVFTLKGTKGALKAESDPEEFILFEANSLDDDFNVNPIVKMHLKKGNGKQLEWQSDPVPEKFKFQSGQFVFVQQIKGRDEALSQIDKNVKNDADTFFNKFLNIGRSVYVGGRYGLPLNGQDVLKKAPMIGLFGEFKGGLFEGFKVTYDLIPKQDYVSTIGVTQFQWTRLQLGYAFSRAFQNKWLNWVDFAPRLGVTTLNYDFVATDPLVTSYQFKLNKAPTVGGEAGLENRNNYFRLRLWTFASYSVGILPIDKLYRTTSLRAGVDVYREFLSFRSFKLAALVFSAADRTIISRKTTDEELAADQTIVPELSFTSIYVGGGLTLTW